MELEVGEGGEGQGTKEERNGKGKKGGCTMTRSVMEEVHVTLHFRHHSKRAHLAVTNLGQQTV